MRKLINWCSQYGLSVITLFLLAFIPLYPKIPLLDIKQTWVSVRFEDFLIVVAAIALFVTYLRNRRHIDISPLGRTIILYWIVGFISLANALLFIFPHLTGVLFPYLAVLHFFRRIEYMLLFFVAFEAFRKKSFLISLLWTLCISYVLIVLYGFGQKFLGFPAFLTMNEEFAKGIPLRLPSNARFPSTFGGHYDLAAYLVLVIPIMGSLLFGMQKWWQKILFFALTFLGLEMLLFTASRISFGVYLVAMTAMLIWQKRSVFIIPMVALSILAMVFTSGASERFYKTFSVSNVVVDLSTGRTIGTLDTLNGTQATLEPIASPAQESLPRGSEYINLASDEVSGDQIKQVQFYKSVDVTGATGDMATVSGSFLIQKALVYDISITTRFQGEWPKAIEAFKRNYLLGSGYSSLSVAVDGDYHRMLGETGVLGAVAFLGIFAAAFWLFKKYNETLLPIERAFVIGLFAGIVGLLVNAVLIDVFEASKVAYTLWSLLGIAVAILIRGKKIPLHYFTLLKYIATRPVSYIFYLLLGVTLVWGKTFNLYFLGDDFTWLRWAAESKVSDMLSFFTQSQGFWYRPIPKLWYFALFSTVWLKQGIYHGLSVVLLLATTFFIYRILTIRAVGRVFAWAGAFLFAVLSVHHENVYWISGQSSMLAGFFLLFAVYLYEESFVVLKRIPKFLIAIKVIVLTLLAMFSYDGMVIAPLIVAIIIWSKNKRSVVPWILLLCIPFYIWMRQSATALLPQGNYGYKMSTFFVNTVSNVLGYTVSLFGGPTYIELWNKWRVVSRPYLKEISIGAGIIGLALLGWLLRLRKIILEARDVLVFILAYVIAFAAYAPLGGMADRYVYIPSMFFVIAIVILFSRVFKTSQKWGVKAAICIGYVLIIVWNIKEVQRLGNDWEFASKVAEQALLVIKKETYPPKDVKTFFFIPSIPIRYGSAWIFPTGMNDAIWHMYRQSPYRIFTLPTIEDAYKFPVLLGDREIFVFDNYKLKRGIKETKFIPVDQKTNNP